MTDYCKHEIAAGACATCDPDVDERLEARRLSKASACNYGRSVLGEVVAKITRDGSIKGTRVA